MTELDYSVLDPLEPLDENKGVDYSVLEPLTPETRAKDKQQKDIAELTARKEALEGRIATVSASPNLSSVTATGGLMPGSTLNRESNKETKKLEKEREELRGQLKNAENRDLLWDTVMFDDFKHDERTIKALKESLDNLSRNPSPNLEPDKHYHNTERLNKIAKHYENEDEQSQVYRHFTEEELFDEKTRQKRFAELGLDDRAMADQIRGLLGNFEEAGLNIPVDKALATTVVNSVLDNMFKERVLELAKVPFAYDGEGNVQGKTGFGRSVRLNRQILDGEDYVEPTWGNLIKAGFKSVFYSMAGQNQAQAEYDRQLSELAQGKDIGITEYVSVPAGGVGGGTVGIKKVVDPKTWDDQQWSEFARTHNLMDAWEGIPKDASPEDKYAAMQQAAGKELYRKQQNRKNAEEIMRITGTHRIRSGFGEAWGSLGWRLQFALGGAVVGQTAMKGAQEQTDRLLTAKFNEDGSVQYEENSFDRAFTQGLLNASVETASEFTSEVIWDAMFKALFSKLPGTDVLAKNVTKQMVKRSSGRAILRTARQMAAMGKAVHRGGVLSEHMEEVTAGFFNALFNYEMLDSEALATGSTVGGRVREFFTPKNQLQTLEQVVYTTLLLGAVGLPIGGAQAAIGEYKSNNALRSTLRHLGMDLQASEALLDRDLSTQIQATFNELGRRVKEGQKLDPVISTYLMAYYGASKDVRKNMSARERNDYLAKRLQEKSVIDDNNARALLHETGVKPEVTEKMNSEELQEAVLDVLGTLKNGLGEETLARILEEAGIDPKAIPDNIAGKVKLAREIITSGQFRVLQIETRKFDKAMQLEAQRMADAQAWAIQSEENSKATFEGDLTPLLESPLENPVVSDDNVTIFLDPENNRYVVSNKITGRDDMVFVPFTPDQKADAKALQEAADRQARIADVARETLNRRESIIQTAAGNLLRNGEKVTLVDNTEQAQRYLESKGIDKPVTGRVPGLTLKGRNEILLIRDNISSSMLLMETLLHERFHLALDNLGITNEQFAKFVAKATGLNEKEILEDAEKIRKTYSKQGVKLDLNQAIEEAVAHKLETGQLLFEPSLWRYLGDKALGIKSHKISNDLGRVLAGLDNIQSKFNKGWEADSAPLEEQGKAEQETQQPETEQGTEQEQPEVVPEATSEATPEAAPETAPQEKISPKGPDIPGMLSQVGLTKKNILDAKLDKDQIAELYNTIEQWLEDGDNAPLDAILERFDLPRPEIQEKGEDAQDATPDAPVEEKTDQEAQSETETEPETVETEQEPAPEKEPEESKPEEKEPEPEPREPSITIKDLAKLGEDAKNGDKEAHKKLVELLGEDNAVILQGDVVDYDTATQEQLKDAEETGKVINDFPLSEVHFDPDRFQFRYIYGEKGASGALEGIKKYDKKQGGTLWLWRDPKDGKAYVVNGHNRAAAAIRLGVTHHNVAFFQAKSDGEARRMGAEMNIREGNGSALDAAKFFRETKMTLEDFEALNIPMRQSMGKRGYALAQLVESLFRKVVSGEIDESVGVAIGENLPDLNAQVQLMEYLKKQRKRDLTIEVVAEIAKIANVAVEKETKEGGAEQIDLFGEEVGRNKLILETAQVRAEIARRLGRDKRLFGMVSKLTNKERLEQEGNLIDAERGKAISQEAGLILNLFHILKETDLVKVIEQAAQEVANGTRISKAVGDIMGEVKTTVLTAIGREVEGVEQTGDDIPSSGGDVQKPSETGTATPREDLTLDALTPEQEKAEQEKIKEQKRKRAEREEIEKRTAAPLKGDSGDLTSTLPSMEGTSDAPLFTENDRIGEQEKGGEKAEPAKTPDKQPEPAEPQKPTARTEFIARGTKVVGKDTDGVAYSGEIEAYNAADDTYTLNVLKVKQPGKAMLPLPIDMKTGNRQVLKKNLPADSVNPIDVNKGPSKLTEAEKRKLRIMDAARDSEIGADIDESISERLERVGGEEVQTPGDKDAAKYGNKSVTDNEIRFKITPEVDAQQRDWAWKYRNGILPIEDKRAAEAIIDRINAARGLPDVVYHGSPTAAGLMKSGGFDVGKRGDLTRAPSARLADFFAGNKGTSAIYAALKLSEPMFGPWGTQPQNMNEVLGAVDDMVFGATYSGNRTQGDGSVQSSNPVFWNAYGEYIENVMAAKTAEQRRDLTIDFLNAEDPELRDSMIDAYEEELDRYTENSEQEAAEELYGDDIGDAWREDDDKRDEVYERAREYALDMVEPPRFMTREPVSKKDLSTYQFEWNPNNLPSTEGIERFAIDASKLKRIEYNKEGRNPTGSFAEHLEKAKQEGYEGVAFVDVKDGAGFDTVYALFENATRKSANPFTYDDKGELIPFSERAGDPTKDDIRYKITGDEVAAMWPDYFEDQEQRERLQALRGEREKFYSHENREITGIALDSSKATTEDFLRRVYKMGVETVQNRQADSEVVERSTNTFATEKGKLRALELVEEYASLDGQDLSQFNKRAPSVDERMLMFQLMRQHVFHLENASERFLRSEGAERNAIGQEMRALEGSLDRVITGLRVASTLAGRVLRNHQVGLDSLNMLVYRMARAEREKGSPLNEDEKREIMEKFKAYEQEHAKLTEELNQMEKQYQSERMAKEIAERDFAVAKEAIAKLGAFKEIEKDVLGSLDIPVTGIMFKITPEEDAAHLDAAPRFKLPGVTLSEAAREYLAAAQAAVDAVPPKADGSVDLEERQRVLDEWKADPANAAVAMGLDYGVEIRVGEHGVGGESTGGRATVGSDTTPVRPFAADWTKRDAADFQTSREYPQNQATAAHEIVHSLFSRNPQTAHAALESLISQGVPRDQAFESLVDLGGLYLLEPRAITDAAQRRIIGDWLDAHIRTALDQSPLTLRPDGTLAGVQEQADIRFKLPAVTPEQDKAYMDAVERGDTETAQRMVDAAARRAGYNVKAYHGTDAEFTVFDQAKVGKKTGHPSAQLGFFFSSSRKVAEGFSKNNRGAAFGFSGGPSNRIVESYLKIKNPKAVTRKEFTDDLGTSSRYSDEYGFLATPETWQEYRAGLVAAGHDGVKIAADSARSVAEEFKYDSYAVFSPSQIKSADPVTYDDAGNVIPLSERFNEQSDDIRFKLPGVTLDAEYMSAVEKGDRDGDNLVELLRKTEKDVRDKAVAAWLERNPETAKRLEKMVEEAARKAGYDRETFRGDTMANDIFVYSPSERREVGIFTTPEKEIADVYAGASNGRRLNNSARRFYVRAPNTLDLTKDTMANRRWVAKWSESFDEWVDRQSGETTSAWDVLESGRMFDYEGDWSSERWGDLQATAEYEGYDAVVLPDFDNGRGVFPSLVIFDSNNLKLADPVTYDDAGRIIPPSERFNEQSDDIRYKITPDPMSLEEIQSRVSTGQLTAQEFVAKFAQEALARGYEPEEVKAYLKRVLIERGAKEKPGVKQQQPKQPSDPKKAKVPYNDKDGNPEPKKVAKYAWALALKEYGDIHGFELEEMSKEHLYGVIDNAVNIANEIMGVEIFDREQLIRLTTGYGKVTEKKRTEFDRALSKTRSMLLSLARINDLAYGNRAKKVETDRLKTVPLMRELAQEVLNMLDRGVATGILPDVDIETVKDVLNSRFDNMRRALKMAIQELAQAIERGTPTTRGEKQEYEDPPDIKELKRIKKELQAVHDAMPAVQERKKARYLENRVTNLKKQISALDEKIEKAKQGVFETVEKKARPTTQEINDLTAERDGKKKELRELEANDLGQQAKRYEEAMKRLQEVGQQLTEALEAGETIPHKDTEPLTEKQLQLEARRRANTELRKQLRDNWALENEDAAERISLTRQLNTLLRQESRLQRLISDKDFQPRVTKDPPVNWQIIKKRNQIAALRSKYEMEARNLEYRMSGFKGKVKAHWETADTVARMWKTWADVSAFVQTGLLAAGHPILASRAFMDATSNAWSERHYIEFWQKIEQDPFYQAFIVNGGKAHQEVDVYQGGNAANVLVQTMKDSQNKVTSLVGQGIDISQKHFNIFVSMMRFYTFKSIVTAQNLDINNKEHAIQLKQIANMVNQLGGAGTMPGKNLKKMFWSSAMMAAQIATATGGAGIIYNATLKGEAGKRHVWYEATPGAWKEALRIHAGLLAANLLMNVFQMLMAKLSGDDDPELGDWEGLPTDSTWDMMWRLYSRTFGPQKVGKTNILINGAYPILRLMHETAKTLTDYDTETSKTRKIGGELARFASGRANPLMSDIVQLLLGRDYMGEPYGPMIFPKLFESQFAKDEKKVTWGDVGQGMVNMTINTLVPLAQRELIETTVDVAEEFGIFGLMAAPVTMSLAMMGWAKSTYPVSHTRQRFEVEKIMRDYERIKKEGTREQQGEYRERYGWVVRNEKGFKSHIKRMRDARKSGDEDKIRETGRDFYHYYIEKTERSGVGALW